jgi:hypothetical protein
VDLEGKGTAILDHVEYAKCGSGGHTTVLADGFTSSEAILGGFKSKVQCLFADRPACMMYGHRLRISMQCHVYRLMQRNVPGAGSSPLQGGCRLTVAREHAGEHC